MQGVVNLSRDSCVSINAETPSKVEALVHAIEDLIAQAGHAGHGDIAHSASNSLNRGVSVPNTPLRSAESAPAVSFGSCGFLDMKAHSTCMTAASSTSKSRCGGADHTSIMMPLAHTSALQPCPSSGNGSPETSSCSAKLGATDLVPQPGHVTSSATGMQAVTHAAASHLVDGFEGSSSDIANSQGCTSLMQPHQTLQGKPSPPEESQAAAAAVSVSQDADSRPDAHSINMPLHVRFAGSGMCHVDGDGGANEPGSAPWTQLSNCKSTVRLC